MFDAYCDADIISLVSYLYSSRNKNDVTYFRLQEFILVVDNMECSNQDGTHSEFINTNGGREGRSHAKNQEQNVPIV